MKRDRRDRCFHLDGQTSLVRDYLDLRPERRDELARQLRAGRIMIGPWFVMADEFLVPPGTRVWAPLKCPHGRITQWSGWAKRGERLPDVEHCEQCNPGAVPLDVPEEAAEGSIRPLTPSWHTFPSASTTRMAIPAIGVPTSTNGLPSPGSATRVAAVPKSMARSACSSDEIRESILARRQNRN